MKNTSLLLTLILTILFPWMRLSAQGSLTVNNGTEENGVVPASLAFIDAPYQHSQFLIPASGLAAANGMSLTSMQFYTTAASTYTFSNNWVITLMETSATTIPTTYTSVSSGTVTYSGTINWQSTTPLITFDIPFVYHGGNLLVDMRYSNSPATDYDFISFYGVTSSNLSIGNVAYSEPSTGEAQSFSPKTTFTYATTSSCLPPSALTISSLTSSSAAASWTSSGASQYQYLVVASGTTPDWSSATLVTSTSCSLAGLSANTSYDLYVRSYCSSSSQSAAAKVIFHTLCASTTPDALGTVGFESSEGFVSGLGNLNGVNCWTAGNANSSDAAYIPYVTYSDAYRGDNCLSLTAMRNTWTNADRAYAVLPELSFPADITTYELSFFAKKENSSAYYNDTLWVGIMTDPEDISTFTTVGFAKVNSTSYSSYTVSFQNYTGTGGYVAILARVKPSSSYSTARFASFFVDDISVVQTPSCRAIRSLSVSDVTRTSANVNWQTYPNVVNCTGFQLLCSSNPDPSQATETPVAITPASLRTYALTNLERNTLYYIHLRSNCGGSGYSDWLTTSVTTQNLSADCSTTTPDTIVSGDVPIEEMPWGGLYNSYYTQQIYTASELSAAGLSAGYIGNIAFLYALNTAYTKDVTIYMGLTTESQMTTSFLPVTLCSNTTPVTFANSGEWYDFDLDNAFYWDGTSNIVVGFLATGTTHTTYLETNPFIGGTVTSASAYSRDDSSSPDMTNGIVSSNRANIRISICPLETACPAATDVQAIDITPTTATISWTASTGDYANTYDLYYSTTPVTSFTGKSPQKTNISGTSCTLTGLSNNTRYYAYVRTSCNARGHNEGTSDWSEPAEFVTDLACATPDRFVVEQVYSHKADLSWVRVNSASDWKIYLSGAATQTISVNVSSCTLDGDTVHYSLNSLSPESTYSLTLVADCGSKGISNAAVDTPLITTLSDVVGFSTFTITNAEVIGQVAVNPSSRTVTASLRDGTDLTDISFVAQYKSEYCTARVGNDPFTSPADFTSPLTVRVFAQDTTVYEDWTITLTHESCATPYDLSVSDIQRRSVLLNWTIGNATSTTFDVVASTTPLYNPEAGSLLTVTATNIEGACSYTLTGLTRNTHYHIYIRTNCGLSFGQWRSVECTTANLDPGEPACPGVTDLIATALDESSADISWTACSGDYANTYDVFYTTQDTTGMTITPQMTGLTATSAHISGLATYTLYHVYVRTSCNAEGHDDGLSRWVGTSVRTHAVCRVAGNLTPTLTGKHTATVDWANTSSTPSQANNFTYILSPVAVPLASLDITTPTATNVATLSAAFTNLLSTQTYHFYIRNVCGTSVGNSPWDSCSFTMPVALPAVINLTASDITHNAFTATWESDTAQFADETEWEVAVTPQGVAASSWTSVSSRTYPAMGLVHETTYDLHVRAKDGNNRSAVTSISVTTSALPLSCITLFDEYDFSTETPLFPLYFDQYTKVNTIIPGSELTRIANRDISDISFYVARTDGESTNANVQIYLKEVTATTVTSPINVSTATLVYSGTLSFVEDEPISIHLSAPFHYNGGNLLIATQNTTKDNYVEVEFYGAEGVGSFGSGMNRNSLAGVTSFTYGGTFVPMTTFCYTDLSDCKPVHSLTVSDITPVSASARWYAGNTETQWHLFLSTTPLTDDELDASPYVTVSTPNYLLSNLTRNTDYYLYVRGICDQSEFSSWVEAEFSTLQSTSTYSISCSVAPASSALGTVSLSCLASDTTSDGRFYEYSAPQFTASPRSGFSFTGWTNAHNGNLLSTNNPWTVNVSRDSAFVANFDTLSYLLDVSVAPGHESRGTVSGGGYYRYNSLCQFSATPAPHYHVLWSDNNPNTSRSIVMPAHDTSFVASFIIDSHTLTAVPNELNRGTVSGSGTYNYGDTAVLVANAVAPYVFSRWDDAAATTSDTLRHIVRCDTTVTAIFKLNEFDVIVNSNDASMGSVTGNGVYPWGTTATLTATPAPHHHLLRWSNGATTSSINVTVISDTSFTAIFAIDSFNVHVSSNNPSMGSVSGAGLYAYGETATVSATPAAHHHLVSWNNGVTTLAQNIVVSGDSFLIANFAIDQHSVALSVNTPTLGSVSGAGTYNYGTSVTISATPVSSHAIFNGWSNGDLNATTTITLTGDTSLTANFVLDSHTISATVNDPAMGSVSGAGTFTHGTYVTLTATPAANHHFVSWSNGVTNPVISIIADRDSSLTASFAIDTYTLTLDVNNPSLGSVTGAGTYSHGSNVTITATPRNNHCIFTGWSNGDLNATTSINLISDSSLTATFVLDQHTITATSSDLSMGSVTGGGTYTHGTSVTLTATPAAHHHFLHWSNGVTTSAFTLVADTDSVVTAYFAIDSFTITAHVNDPAMGSVSGAGSYTYNQTATLTATPAANHHFLYWSNGLTSPSINILVDRDSTLTAYFAVNTHTLSLSANNPSLGSVTGAGSYSHGNVVTITATPLSDHSIFTGWSNGDSNDTTTITLVSDSSLTANFILDSHTVTALSSDSTMGSVTGSGVFTHGTSVTLTALPAAHHHFVSWSNGATTPTLSLVVDRDSVVTAYFAIDTHTITAIPNDAARGTVSGSGTYNYGDTAILVAKAIYPYCFTRWDDPASSTTDTLLYVVRYDATLTATFSYIDVDVIATTNDASMGSASGSGSYTWGTAATLVATPAPHHHLLSWSNGATSLTITPTVVRDTTFTATFAIDSFNISAFANNPAMGSVTGSARYPYYSVASLVATPAANHHFVSWNNGITSPSINLLVDRDSSLIANFAINRHTVSLSVNDYSLGYVTGAGTYDYGTDVTITATPLSSHSIFTGWSNGDLNATTVVNLTSDTSLVAYFKPDTHTVTALSSDSAMGTVTGSGTYTHGTSVTLTAHPVAHHHFVSWSNGVTTPSFTLSADRDSTITALFAIDTHTITAIPNDPARGSVTGSGTYNYGDTAILVATAVHPYEFTRWDDPSSTVNDTLRYVVLYDATLTATFSYINVDVIATTNDASMGSASGSGSYVWGSTPSLVATPAPHHHLLHWSNGATTLAITPTVISDTTFTATFAIDSFNVAVSANNPSMGSVTGSGIYPYYTVATLTATPAANHHFVSWSNGATTPTINILVDRDSTLTANFAIDAFTLTLDVNNPSLGSVTGAGTFNHGTSVTITATPASEHSIFTGWSNGDLNATTVINLVSDSSITANFVLDNHTVTALSSDSVMGAVTGSGTYTHGISVTLTATPAAHHHFVSWSNGVTTPSFTLVADRDSVVTAYFAINTHTITAIPNDPARGAVSGSGTYNYGDTAFLVASAFHPYRFTRWNDAASSTTDTLRYVVLYDATLTASFSYIDVDVIARTNDASMGTVSGGGSYVWGTTATLTATPVPNHHLVHWSNGAKTNSINITAVTDTILTATFAIDSFNIRVASNNTSMGSVTGSGYYPYGASATVTATPVDHHHIVNWNNGVTTLSQTVTVSKDSFLIANFAIDRHNLSLSVNNSSLGSVTGTGSYDYGTVVTITATPASDHCIFTGWSNGDLNSTTTITLTSDSSLVANFIPDSHTITAQTSDSAMGVVTGSGTYTHGASVTLTALPAAHHHFVSWSNGVTTPSFTLSADRDSTVTALFAIDTHTITAIPNDPARGTVTGSGTYNYGDTAILIAKAVHPYQFTRWDDPASTTTDTLRYVVRYDATVSAIFAYNEFDVIVLSNDGSMGSVSGGGAYTWGTTATLVATPAPHHHLVHWSNGAKANSINVTVLYDTSFTATFAIDSFNVRVAANHSSMGSVTGTGYYPYGASATVTATPVAHHHLVNWNNGVTTASQTVTVSQDSILIANFAIDRHNLSLSVNNPSLGSVTGAGSYDYGTVVTITATPTDAHSIFTGWSNGDLNATTTVILTADSSLTANFIPDTHTITALTSDSAMGVVTGSGTYTHGTSVTLTATPAAHHHFVSWSNGVTTPSSTLTVDRDSTVTALFAADTHNITAIPNDPARGTVTGSGTYNYGDTAILVATAVHPYEFTRWDDPSSTVNDTLRYVVLYDATLTASFSYINVDVIATTNDASMGSASGSGSYVWGTTGTLTATPAPHHHLLRWSNGANTPVITPTVTSDTTFTATFAIDSFNVSVSANNPSMGVVTGSGIYPYYTVATLTATPAANHHFLNWSNGLTSPSINILVDRDSNLTANFAIDTHTLTLYVNNPTLGSVTGAGTYNHGTSVTITATPASEHSIFTGWSNGDLNATTTINLTSDSTLTANFILDTHTITATSSDMTMGYVTGSGTYTHGISVTLTALPTAHHHFVSWSNGVTTPSFTLTADRDSTVTALFAIDTHTITAIPNDPARGSVTGSGTYNYGDTAILVATAVHPYKFTRWDDHSSSTTDTLRYVVLYDATLTATFTYINVDVIATTNDASMGSASGSGSYVWGSTPSLVATPAPHHHLLHWSNGATTLAITPTVVSDTTFTATFAIDSFNVSVSANNPSMGSVTGSGIYPYYTVATLTATPAANHHFVSWSNGATTPTINILVDRDSNLTANFAIDAFTLTLNVNDASLGSVTGAGSYDYGTSVTITATPASDHSIFTGWSNGDLNASTVINLTSDSTLTANFILDTHTITALSSDITMGTVTGSGTYTHGTSVTLTATPAAHHHFVSWSNGATTPTFTLLANRDTTLTATFAIDTHVITAIPNDPARGAVSGSGTYNYGDTAILIASAFHPYRFTRWDDAASSTTDTLRYVVLYDATLTASFSYIDVDVIARTNDASMGSVSGSGTFTWGTTATLTATPAPHHHLVHWSNGATSNTINITAVSDTTLTATFAIDSFNVHVAANNTTMGSVSGSGRYPYGHSLLVTATPADNHHLLNWNNGVTSLSQYITVTQDSFLIANFAINQFTVTLNVNNPALGTATGSGTYDYGTAVPIIATPTHSHVLFNGWNNGDLNASTVINLTSDTTLTANFTLDTHTITAISANPTMGSVNGSGTYTHGTSVTLIASPAAHHHFTGWSNGVTTPTLTLIADTDSTVTAYFAIDLHTITAIPADTATGSVTGSGTYAYGTSVNLTATPAANHHFLNWSNGATTPVITLTADRDTTLIAYFAIDTYTLTLNVNDPYLGSVTGAGTYAYGSSVTITATALNSHSVFTGWSNGDLNATTSIILTSDSSLTANFVIDSHTITALSNDTSMGVVTGAGTFTHGTTVTLIATPAAHHHFLSWSNGVTSPQLTIVADRDSSVMAYFAIDTYTITAIPNDASRGVVSGSGTYHYGDTALLVARAIFPYEFNRWNDPASTTSDTLRYVVHCDTTVTAIFRLSRFNVSLFSNDTTMGTLSGDGSYNWGTTATLVATPTPNHHLVRWSNGATSNTINVTVLSDTSFYALFAVDSFTVAAYSSNTSMGTVSGSGTYIYNDHALLVATPAPNHHLTSWSNGATTDSIIINVTSDTVLFANFALDQYTVTLSTNNPALGSVTGSGTYNYGSLVTISATPVSSHSIFTGWSNGDTNPVTTINLVSDTALTANFVPDSHTITALSNDTLMGFAVGSGTYTHGTSVAVTAIPADNYHFVSWSNGATTPVITIVADRDSTVTAYFALDEHIVSAVPNDTLGGYVLGSGIYNHGDMVRLMAIAHAHYRFVGWSNGDTSSTIIFSVLSDTSLVAYFDIAQYNIVAAVNDSTMGSTIGSGIYLDGSTVTLAAITNYGYRFDGWSNGDTSAVISFIATSDTILTANFSPIPSSVDQTEADSYVAYTEYFDIVVSGAAGHTVTLYDMNGRLVQTITHASDLERLTVHAVGIYIIHVDHLPPTRLLVK